MITRVDDIIEHPGGQLEVRFTSGEAPLPAAWGGHACWYWISELPARAQRVEEFVKRAELDDVVLLVRDAVQGGRVRDAVGKVTPDRRGGKR